MGNAAWVEALAVNIPKGTSTREVCPKCKGGSDGEKCLSISVDLNFGVHWKCFRSSCGFAGGPRGVPNAFGGGVKREPRYYTRPYRPLTQVQHDFFYAKFGIDPVEIAGYSAETDRFIFPVFGDGLGFEYRGCMARSFSGEQPKSLTYNEQPDKPFIHFAYPNSLPDARAVVVVEDWLSAEKVAQSDEVVAVALNGTRITQEMISEISTVAQRPPGRPTYLALDKDAFCKSVKYVHRYREQFPGGLYVWALSRDLKYEAGEAIRAAIRAGKGAEFGEKHGA